MPRAIWSGAVSFGLVNIPVKLFSAVSQKEVRFHMLHDADGGRIHFKRVCAVDGDEVPFEHIVKGYEIAKNQYVQVTKEELEAFDPKGSRTVEIRDFVDLADIDPIFYETTYYLVPEKGAAKAYALLLEAMKRSGRVAIATMVLRTKEYLCCVRPMGDALAVSTMNHADELVPQSSLELPERAHPTERELAMAEQLVDSLSTKFDAKRYPDVYREKVRALVEKKAEGETIQAPAEEEPAKVVNLADALSASLAAAKARGPGKEAAPAAGERRHRQRAAARTTTTRRRARKKPA
jgi:DNA end-binding protein Ku